MKQRTVLLVESDVLIRHSLAEYLRDCAYKVVEAIGSKEARQILDRRADEIDVMLVDATEKTGQGFQLATWARVNHPAIRIVLAGGLEDAADKAGLLCADQPASLRPYDYSVFHERIRQVLSGRKEPEGSSTAS